VQTITTYSADKIFIQRRQHLHSAQTTTIFAMETKSTCSKYKLALPAVTAWNNTSRCKKRIQDLYFVLVSNIL